jgi:hypothetical protein
MDICHPVHQLLDARTRQLFTTLTQTIATHIDPWRSYLQATSTAPPPGLASPSTSYRDAIESAITIATEDLVDIYTTFISSHIQPLAHTEHGKHFAVSPTGLLRYTPHATQTHPRRISSRDLLDISPDIIQLDSLVGNLIEAHGRILQEGIWQISHKHQQQWHKDLQALGQMHQLSSADHHLTSTGPRTHAPKPRPNAPNPAKKPLKTPRPQPPQSPAYLITPSNAPATQESMDLTRSAYSAHDTTDPSITPMHTMLQSQAYRLPPQRVPIRGRHSD